MTAAATSLKDFNAMPEQAQAAFVQGFIDKKTADLRTKNPQLATDIQNWFVVKQPGKPVSEGMERLSAKLGALATQAKSGKADLSKAQLESVILWLIRQKFPVPIH